MPPAQRPPQLLGRCHPERRTQRRQGQGVPKADLDAYLGSGYGIFAGRKVEWASLKFTPKAARWVSAQRWHPDERHRVESDGSYILEVPYADDRELVMEILKHGPDVEVLAPPSLRRRVADSHKEGARRYE